MHIRTENIQIVHRKDSYSNLYLHWDAFAPISWKCGTLRTLVNKAYLVCSNKELLHQELAYLRTIFFKKNGYPLQTIKQKKESRRKSKTKEVTQINMTVHPNPQNHRVHSLLLTFAGSRHTTFVKNLNKTLKNILLTM